MFYPGKPAKRFTLPLTAEAVYSLPQRDFVDYCREQLWDRIGREKFGKTYEELDLFEWMDVDMEALLQIAKAVHQVQEEARS